MSHTLFVVHVDGWYIMAYVLGMVIISAFGGRWSERTTIRRANRLAAAIRAEEDA